MKKHIQSWLLVAAILTFVSCSSENDEIVADNETNKLMTFTATQEGDAVNTKTALYSDGKTIIWQTNDKISIFDGNGNHTFELKTGAGTNSATFEGTASEAESYTAIYPYQQNATLSDGNVTNVTLPATQKAIEGGFDPTAALMMAQSINTSLQFKNVVGYVKVKPNFACSKIVLRSGSASEYLAGTGTLTYNSGDPTFNFTTSKSHSITLEGNIESEKTYYIAVPTTRLTAGWTISFTTSDGSNVYTRKSKKDITFTRNKVINLGDFKTEGKYWCDKERGIVEENQEVYMGNFTIEKKTYKVYFAKSNLTATGLAAKETDFGDYFAWASTEPWLTSYTPSDSTLYNCIWKTGKSSGYTENNAPYYTNSSYSKYTSQGNTLDPSDDAARQILGGKWQVPTAYILYELCNQTKFTWSWSNNGMKISNGTNSIFLPAAGFIDGNDLSTSINEGGSYWSNMANSTSNAFYLYFNQTSRERNISDRYFGLPIRPVRLVKPE